MNVVLQIMINTEPIVKYYETSQIKKYINIYNNNGSKGKMIAAFSAYANCYKSKKYSVLNMEAFLVIFIYL